MCNLKIEESAFREFTAIHTINGNRLTNEKILSDVGSYRDKYFKGYDIMIYDFFMMKKRRIKNNRNPKMKLIFILLFSLALKVKSYTSKKN